MQQTLSVYLFAYAFMMLWHGALSDALGRRPVIIAGLAVYAFATLGCAIAGNIETLWLFRARRASPREPAWSSAARSSATASTAPRRNG